MIRAYLKRLFCQPATEAEYIAECNRICRKMTGRSLGELPPWNFGMAYEDGVYPRDAVLAMIRHNPIKASTFITIENEERKSRVAKAKGMHFAADILMRNFGVPLRPVEAWSDAEKRAYEIGQREASKLWQEMILREADKVHKDPMLITHGCCCTGPARGETKCPCKLLWERVKGRWE